MYLQGGYMREILFRGQTRRYGEKVRTLKE
nr:MAG TPA: hypothetical protein [Caudoviricetes sp.]